MKNCIIALIFSILSIVTHLAQAQIQCDCIINDGKNTLLAHGSVLYHGTTALTNQRSYSLDINFYNKSNCELKMTSAQIGKIAINPNVTLTPNNRENHYQTKVSSTKFMVMSRESTPTQGMTTLSIQYLLNGKACSQSFLIGYYDESKK